MNSPLNVSEGGTDYKLTQKVFLKFICPPLNSQVETNHD